MTRTKSNARSATNRSKKTSIGIHGEEALEMLFRLGGCTAGQMEALMDMRPTIARRTLGRLEANGYVTTTADFARYQEKKELTGEEARGRPPDFYYLTPRGQDYAGRLAGAEDEREARLAYKRHGLPGLAAHSSIENRVLLAVTQAAGKEGERKRGWRLGPEDCVCESALDYPLRTGEKKSAKGSQVRELYPDGEFAASTPSGRCVYMIEVESDLRARRLVRKVQDYASWQMAAEMVRPLLLVALSERQAVSMRTACREALAGRNAEGEFRKWADLFARKGRGRAAHEQIQAGLLVAFASLQELEEAYGDEGLDAPIWATMAAADSGGSPVCLALEHLAELASEAREMIYGVREVS